MVGVGIKAVWSPDELARAQALAARPVSWFDTREQAAARHLLVAGLTGLVDPDDDAVTGGCSSRTPAGGSRSTRGPSAWAHPTCPARWQRPAHRSCWLVASTTRW